MISYPLARQMKEHVLKYIDSQLLSLQKEKDSIIELINAKPYECMLALREKMELDQEQASKDKEWDKAPKIIEAYKKAYNAQMKIAGKQGNFTHLYAELSRIDSIISWLNDRKYFENNR